MLTFCPDKSSLQTESPNVLKYIREWSRLSLVDGVLYRNTTLNNVQTRQLVLPLHFRSIILKQLHNDLGHQGRDRTLSLVRSRFYWPGLENDVEEKIKNCGRCIRRKTPVKPSAELVNTHMHKITDQIKLLMVQKKSPKRRNEGKNWGKN